MIIINKKITIDDHCQLSQSNNHRMIITIHQSIKQNNDQLIENVINNDHQWNHQLMIIIK
jgi:hypothetical protein